MQRACRGAVRVPLVPCIEPLVPCVVPLEPCAVPLVPTLCSTLGPLWDSRWELPFSARVCAHLLSQPVSRCCHIHLAWGSSGYRTAKIPHCANTPPYIVFAQLLARRPMRPLRAIFCPPPPVLQPYTDVTVFDYQPPYWCCARGLESGVVAYFRA